MNKMNKLMVLASLLAAPTLALASETAPMSVTGTFTPTACALSLDKTSIDMGEIPLGNLVAAKDYPAVPLTLTVNCGTTNTKVAVKAQDNKEAPDTDHSHYGLGKVGSNQIGYYMLSAQLTGNTLDGATAALAYGIDSPSQHGVAGAGSDWYRDHTNEFGIGTASAWTAGRVHVIQAQVTTHINAFTSTSLTANTPIDGSVTLDVQYP